MLMTDGVTPGNEARGYVLRRLLRRSVRAMRLLGVHDPVLPELLPVSKALMEESYPEVATEWARTSASAYAEEESFRRTLAAGTQIFDVAVKNKTPIIERNHTTRSPEDFARLEHLVETAERIVSHELYYPSEQSFACGGCAFQGPCKAWHRQAARTTVNLAA